MSKVYNYYSSLENFKQDSFTQHLNSYSLFEKFGWLEETYGDYQALDMLFSELKNSVLLEKACLEAVEVYGENIGDDMLAWYLEGNSAFDLISFLVEHGEVGEVEHVVDELLSEFN